MPLTPEQLARQTAWSLDAWQRAEQITGNLWPAVQRSIAELAGTIGARPDTIAALLFSPDHPIRASLDAATDSP